MNETTNYKLKKPESNEHVSIDIINDNMDAIDEELHNNKQHSEKHDNPHNVTAEQVGARPDTWMPTASELGAISITDVKIANTDLNDYTESGFYFFSSAYTPTNIPTGANGWLLVLNSYQGMVKQYWWRAGTANANDTQQYTRTFLSNSWSDWSTHFLPLTGGTLLGDLIIQKLASPRIGLDNMTDGSRGNIINGNGGFLGLGIYNIAGDSSNYRQITLRNSSNINGSVLANSAFLRDVVNSVSKDYLLYGEHNITAGTTALTAGTSALTTGCIYEMYE